MIHTYTNKMFTCTIAPLSVPSSTALCTRLTLHASPLIASSYNKRPNRAFCGSWGTQHTNRVFL